MPQCLGYFAQGDLECDGPPGPPSKQAPCAWRNVCRCYKEACQLRGVEPVVERKVLPSKALLELVMTALSNIAPNDNAGQARVLRAWQRFIEAFKDVMPRMTINANMAAALPGELYEHTWFGINKRSKKVKPAPYVRCKLLRLRLGGPGSNMWNDLTLLKFWPVFNSKVEPTIEFRADQATVLAQYPQLLGWAVRFSTHGDQIHAGLGFAAVRVGAEHVADMARLFAAALRAGHIRGVAVGRGDTWLQCSVGPGRVRGPKKAAE